MLLPPPGTKTETDLVSETLRSLVSLRISEIVKVQNPINPECSWVLHPAVLYIYMHLFSYHLCTSIYGYL
jgi:hypothetical protein